MPTKKNPESQKEQSERFKKTVADLVDAGELDPDEANASFEKLMALVSEKSKNTKNESAQ